MLIADYIKSKLGKFGVAIDDNELEAMFVKNNIAPDDTYIIDSVDKIERALYDYIPELLVVASVSEGGYGISYDREGILDYYALLCHNLGLENKFIVQQPKVRNKSYLW